MLLAFDLDNTVLTATGDLPDRIRTAIATARDAGWRLAVLTGRPLPSARPHVEALGLLPGPYAVNHGAQVFGPDGAVLRHRRLHGACLQALLSSPLRPDGVQYRCVVGDRLLVEDPHDPCWSWARTVHRRVERIDVAAIDIADKVVYAPSADAPGMLRRLHDAWPLTSYHWDDGLVEVTADDADKGSALARIAAAMGVPQDRTVAFGDGVNDVSMLAWAGHGVAVGPDPAPDLLAVAQERIDAPERGGVADWLHARLA
ncbi:MAG: HAD family hydrolase [Trueperaceae bacterium]